MRGLRLDGEAEAKSENTYESSNDTSLNGRRTTNLKSTHWKVIIKTIKNITIKCLHYIIVESFNLIIYQINYNSYATNRTDTRTHTIYTKLCTQ